MKESYDDIRERIADQPSWFDANGTPRYGEFHPERSPNVYADEVLLYEIECQACRRRFWVEEHWSKLSVASIIKGQRIPSLAERVRSREIHYGDPPCFEPDQCSGSTMNCFDIRTVQFWSRLNERREWVRVPELEGLPLEDAEEKGGANEQTGQLETAAATAGER